MRAFLLCFILILPSVADARSVSCRLLSFGAKENSTPMLALSDKGDEIPCVLSSGTLSEPIVFFADNGRIRFFSPGEREPTATATIPSSVSNALLIFVKTATSAENTLPWRILVVEDSAKNFPDGGAFIANFYNKNIRFVVGEHKGMLNPAGNHGYPLPTKRDEFNMAPVIFEFLQDDKWRTASESSLRFLPGMRYLIIAYVDPASGRPRIRTFQDFASAPRQAP